MNRSHLLFIALFAVALLGGYLFSSGRLDINLDQYAPQAPGGDFVLRSQQGPVKLSDFEGKVVLIYFGYTHCPDICPTALALTTAALKQLDEAQLQQVQTLIITVDPDRDDVDRMEEYAKFFHPSVIGLTGTLEEIDDITRRYGAYYRIPQDRSGNYAVDHSSQTALIGKDGKIKYMIPHATAPGKVLEILKPYLS